MADALKDFASVRKDCWPKRFSDSREAGRLIQDQPSDQWVLYQGTFYLVEVKSSNDPMKFYFKNIQPSQLIGARRSHAAGGRTTFMIVKLPEWLWFKIDGMRIVELKDQGEAGISWTDMQYVPKLSAEVILL